MKSFPLPKGIDALMVTNPINIKYLSNFEGSFGILLITKKKQYLITDARYTLYAQKIVTKETTVCDTRKPLESLKKALIKHKVKNLGFEAHHLTVARLTQFKKLLKGVSFKKTQNIVKEIRTIKSAEELKLIKKSQKINDTVFSLLKEKIKAGMTEQEIAWKIEILAREQGAEGLSFPPIVAINQHSASPHHHNTTKKLKKGDLILVDMGVIYKGYCSDMTRMVFTKSPTKEQENVYNTVLEAQEKAIKALKKGIKGSDVDKISRSFIDTTTYKNTFTHSLGHGVGLEIHESPNLASKITTKLPLHSVVTIEPGIYLEGKFGVRIEDMAIIKEKSAEVITSTPKTLESCLTKI